MNTPKDKAAGLSLVSLISAQKKTTLVPDNFFTKKEEKNDDMERKMY